MQCGDSAEPRLQEPDQGRGSAARLRQRVEEEWDSLDQTVIDCAMKEWRKNCEHALHLTGDTSYMHCEQDCFAVCFKAARLLDY